MDDYDVHLIHLFINHATSITYTEPSDLVERAEMLAGFFTDNGWFNGIQGKANIVKVFESERPIRGKCTHLRFVEKACDCNPDQCLHPIARYYECTMYKGLGDVETIKIYFKNRNNKDTEGIGNEFERVEIKPAGQVETIFSSAVGWFLTCVPNIY